METVKMSDDDLKEITIGWNGSGGVVTALDVRRKGFSAFNDVHSWTESGRTSYAAIVQAAEDQFLKDTNEYRKRRGLEPIQG